MIFYIGCALIPTPPSPCPDFGLQLLFVLIIGLISPKFLIRPINILAVFLGRALRWFFGKIPLIRIIVEKTDKLLHSWEKSVGKKREFKNRYINWLLKLILKKDIFQRIIFGYFVSIVVGVVLMFSSLFLL